MVLKLQNNCRRNSFERELKEPEGFFHLLQY